MTRALIALALLLAWGSSAHAGKADDTLNVAFGNEVETLDNYKATGREALMVTRLLYDSLLHKNAATGAFEPELASSYKVVDDKTLDFTLREDVTFHDGSKMTADDVVYTLNLVSSPQYNARYQIAVNWIESVEKTGDYAVRIHLKTVFPMALEMLAGNLPIYPKAYYEKVGSAGMAINPVGAGPYRLVEMTPGTRFVLQRFDGYYPESPRGRPPIRNVVIRVLPEANTQYAELINGQLDWIWRVPPDAARNLARQPGIKIEVAEIMRFAYLAMNPHYMEDASPIAKVDVRRAINHAIDRPAIVKALVGGASKVIDGPCNPIQFGCAPAGITYPFDPAKAKQLLAAAGYPNGIDVELLASAMPHEQTEAIAAFLTKAGIRTTVNEQQPASALSAWRAGHAAMYLTNWGSYGIGDVGLSVGQFFTGTGDDVVKDPSVIKTLQEDGASSDRTVRAAAYAKAIHEIVDQAYWVPLWTYSVNCAQAKGLDFKLGADEFAPFYEAHWE